ncbi:hypothetical protein TYRP_005508 [Tyrophagus putrescentiae]|nr:hypothetical protein TYRP_005508 [Tyrophagus putrescentiae]
MSAFLSLMGAYKHHSKEVTGLFNIAESTDRAIFTAFMTFTWITTLLRHIRLGGHPLANFTTGEHLTVDHLLKKGALEKRSLPQESTTLKIFFLADSMTSYVLNVLLEGYQSTEE